MDLIDRQALYIAFESIDWYSTHKGKLTEGSTSDKDSYIKWLDALKTIDDAPTVEPPRCEACQNLRAAMDAANLNSKLLKSYIKQKRMTNLEFLADFLGMQPVTEEWQIEEISNHLCRIVNAPTKDVWNSCQSCIAKEYCGNKNGFLTWLNNMRGEEDENV